MFENLLLGADAQFAFAGQFLNRRRMLETARHMMDLAGCDIDVRKTTSDLSFSQRQLVEIIRACLAPSVLWGIENPIVLLDEPTASLELGDEAIFRDLVERTRQAGGLLFVSHRLGEVLELADTIVVLKDGRTVASVDPDTHGEKELHRLMVGRERDRDYYHEDRQIDTSFRPPAIEVRGLTRERAYSDVSFSVAPGEIFGIGGLLESGKSDCAKGLSGVVPPRSGTVRLAGGEWRKPAIADMIADGMAYVPSERLVEGMIAPQSVAWNVALGNGDQFSNRLGFGVTGKSARLRKRTIDRVGVKADGPSTRVVTVFPAATSKRSCLGRWLLRDLKVLILDNPDPRRRCGCQGEIYRLIRDLTNSGVAIVLISDELLELIGMSNRIAIMRHGRIETHAACRYETNRPNRRWSNHVVGRTQSADAERSAELNRSETRQAPSRIDMRSGLWLPISVVISLILFFSIASDAFLTVRNMTGILGQASTLLLACLGATFVVLMGGIDLSVGAIVLLVGAITVTALNHFDVGTCRQFCRHGYGRLSGAANGTIYAIGRIPSFVVTLGTLSVFTGVAWQILEGRALALFLDVHSKIWPSVKQSRRSPISHCLRSGHGASHGPSRTIHTVRALHVLLGGGEAVARTAGISVTRYKIYAFTLSGMTAGLAGSLAVARLGAAGPTLGQDLLLNTLAAIVVGGTSLSGRHRRGASHTHWRRHNRTARQRAEPDGCQPVHADDHQGCRRHSGAVLIGQDRSKSGIIK